MPESNFGGTIGERQDNTLSLETPTGDVDGVNDTFVFTSPPKFVTYQGVIQDEGVDYTLAASTVTFTVPPVSGTVKGLVGSGESLFETPTGVVDGVNDEFVFSAPPIFVTYQGVIQDLTIDYTLVGSTVTFVVPPVSGTVKGLVVA